MNQIAKDALSEINKFRARAGMRPVRYIRKGARGYGWRCPIVNTLAVGFKGERDSFASGVWVSRADWRLGELREDTPEAVVLFVNKFDAADPELAEYAAPITDFPERKGVA